jgi:DNA-nicking Smr family endonuclease
MTRRPRGLRPDEHELWLRVTATANAIHPDHPRSVDTTRSKPKRPVFKPKAFQLGEAARPIPKGHDLAPSLEERMAAQPLRMDRRAHQQMTRGKFQPEARIDLHGMTQAQAHPELIRFVLSAHGAGKRLLLVITGKGKAGLDFGPIPQRMGVLRHQVPQWLAQPPLGGIVLQVSPAHQKHGGAGALYIYLRRGR